MLLLKPIQCLFRFYRLTCYLLFISSLLTGQNRVCPQHYFASPIDTSLRIAGNFGEMRPNHLHAGFDLRTGAKEGRYILAANEGYVSRIKVSGVGYGKVLYITHPNGFVTVYAHLSSFVGEIGDYVKKLQYEKQQFEVEVYLPKNELKVSKGQWIAISGNSGSSGGPHLHFEVRDEVSERAINPLQFGYEIPDDLPPLINALYMYSFRDSIYQENPLNPSTFPKKIELLKKGGNYILKDSKKPLNVGPSVGFGISAYDRQSFSHYLNSFYSLELWLDSSLIRYEVMDEVGFDESRYVNTLCDYYQLMTNKRWIRKSFSARNNKLSFIKTNLNQGIIHLKDTLTHEMRYTIKDYNGLETTLHFAIKCIPQKNVVPLTNTEIQGIWFDYRKENKISSTNIQAIFPAGIFYDHMRFNYIMSRDSIKNALAPTHTLHHPFVPVHESFSLSIKCKPVPKSLQEKATIVRIGTKNQLISCGGSWNEGFVTTQVKNLGNYTVVLDTTSPTIKPLYLPTHPKSKKKTQQVMPPGPLNLSKNKLLAFKVTDNLSGIKGFAATMDGSWVLTEYDPKNNLIFFTFEENFPTGPHFFYMEVYDERGNKTVFSQEFVR